MGRYAPDRLTRVEATALIRKIRKGLAPYYDLVHPVGSYRRGAKDLGDLDFVVSGKRSLQGIEAYLHSIGLLFTVARSGDHMLSLVLKSGKKTVQVEFTKTKLRHLGAVLLHATGPALFNHELRTFVKVKKGKLNQYGLQSLTTGRSYMVPTEKHVFTKLGLDFIPPKDREDGFWAVRDKYKLHKIKSV